MTRTSPADPAGMPAELAKLADSVSRRTRLWPSEKREVRAELESHFREGLLDPLHQGMTLHERINVLREQFGDAAVAARLIRRAKKRARPMKYKAVMFVGCAALAGLASAGVYAAWIIAGKPNPTVDYLARINEPVTAVPAHDRAWPLLRDAILACQPMPDTLPTAPLPRPGDEHWPEALAWVESNRAILPALHEAAARPAYGYVYDNAEALAFLAELAARRGETENAAAFASPAPPDPLIPPLISTLLPHLQETRQLGRLLIFDARARHDEGDDGGAITALDTASRLGLLLMDGQTCIEQLVGAAVIHISLSDLRSFIYTQTGESVSLLLALQDSPLLKSSVHTPLLNATADRYSIEDAIQYVFTDDGQGSGQLIPEQYARLSAQGVNGDPPADDLSVWWVAVRHADRRSTIEKYEQVWTALEELRSKPLHDSSRYHSEDAFGDLTGENDRFAVLRMLMPSMLRADEIIKATRMELEATRTVLAMAGFRDAEGREPRTLHELTPHYLSAVPEDIYSGRPLGYTVGADGIGVLYSVGENLIDDGGSTEEIQFDGRGVPAHPVPADIVYWPPAEAQR